MSFYNNVSSINIEGIKELLQQATTQLNMYGYTWKDGESFKKLYIPNPKVTYSSESFYINIQSSNHPEINYRFQFNEEDLTKLDSLIKSVPINVLKVQISDVVNLKGIHLLALAIYNPTLNEDGGHDKVYLYTELYENKASEIYKLKKEIQQIVNRNSKEYLRKKYDINTDIDKLIQRLEDIKKM